MPDQWLQDYQECGTLAQQISERIQSSGGAETRSRSEIRTRLNQLKSNTDHLRSSLLRYANRVTQSELTRRENLVDQLVMRHTQLTRQSESSLDPAPSGNSWLGNDDVTSAAQGMDFHDLRQHQQTLIADQDRGLDALGAALQRQKAIGKLIGEEVDDQGGMIDDIALHVDKVDSKLHRETKHVKVVTVKSGNCAMMVIIFLLLVAIVVVACVPGKG